jgi:drug/metabolite transporter (DMT)-like permease
MAITAIVASACCYAYGSSLTKSLAKHVSTFALSAWQMGLGGLMLVFVSAVFEKNFSAHVLAISEVYLSFAYLAFIGSLLGFTSYTYLLRCWPASRVSSYTFVCPIIALVLGYVVLGERVSGLELTASVVMVFGAGLALKV